MKRHQDAYSLFSPGWPCDKAEWAQAILALLAAGLVTASVIFSFYDFFK